ncbi:MAG: hypothetical protein CBD27_05470 [Rhodospirillaceae bacterium TMED167]|nr:hypothetical protein [Rhodospirillaceae bacterium]OUW27807.1 MAG: hypothetical protein CBD27_05470 [Rhodospirillaceae bacterium TMED167]
MKDGFLQEQWYAAAFANEISSDAPFARKICGEDIVFFRASTGEPRALEDRCPHRSVSGNRPSSHLCRRRCVPGARQQFLHQHI